MEIPQPSEAIATAALTTLKPKKSPSAESLSKSTSSTSTEKSKKPSTNKRISSIDGGSTKHNVGQTSDFITPPRDGNDLQDGVASPNHKQEQLPGKGENGSEAAMPEKEKKEIANAEVVQVEQHPPATKTASGNITRSLLEQLEQIEIKTGPAKQQQTDNGANGANYLQVDNNLATPSGSGSALSSRGEYTYVSRCFC